MDVDRKPSMGIQSKALGRTKYTNKNIDLSFTY